MPRYLVLFLVCCTIEPLDALAEAQGHCARLEQQRNRVYEQLRKGYTVARGNRLRARLRELNVQISRDCH